MPICPVIDAQSCGCLITCIQFQQVEIGHSCDLYVNYTNISVFFQLFPSLVEGTNQFSFKRSSKETFLKYHYDQTLDIHFFTFLYAISLF